MEDTDLDARWSTLLSHSELIEKENPIPEEKAMTNRSYDTWGKGMNKTEKKNVQRI